MLDRDEVIKNIVNTKKNNNLFKLFSYEIKIFLKKTF